MTARPSSYLAAILVMRDRTTDLQFVTTIMFPSLTALRKRKCVPSGMTS